MMRSGHDAHARCAGFFGRLLATTIDAAIVCAIFATSFLVFYALLEVTYLAPARRWMAETGDYSPGLAILGGIVFFAFWAFVTGLLISSAYYIIRTVRKGATYGKLMLKYQVVDSARRRIGYKRACLRYLVGYFVSGVPFGLGFLWIVRDARKRAWHDIIAGTYVMTKE
ncbi:MAG: RDD family protein [Chloroflexi bacterium]|nr:RDD family protein [Chloroflexota bacterium]